ncbi:PilN domain-containing protein [Lusitaniella coriacea LEGE 07157]|uniref:PilN domain-containing protein n=1 Tax=Lusitaniella coriacea LEGE 07157 TaxID=945747 RepID=A0A8J7B8M1_9CYAN|nr:PilN domain-containing protein [Lusitaniella coriacea]MBE9114748.1 PilN domain-containing protein [Lusitaniella coriacea LEGE 07157]
MYGLDINFLKDRAPTQVGAGIKKKKKPLSPAVMTPLFVGAAIGLLFPALVAGFWLWVTLETNKVEEDLADLEGELTALEAQDRQIEELKTRIQVAQTQANDLAGVFSQIKSWSAVLQDIRDRIPQGVTIGEIQQAEVTVETPTEEGQPTPQAPIVLSVSGFSQSYNQLNDFLLALKDSEFFNDEETRLLKAELADYPIDNKPEGYEFPQVVKYELITQLSNLPSDELLKELERKGALGLATRLRAVENVEVEVNTQETTGEQPGETQS